MRGVASDERRATPRRDQAARPTPDVSHASSAGHKTNNLKRENENDQTFNYDNMFMSHW